MVQSCGTESEPTYTLTTTVSPEGSGVILPSGGEYSEGEIVTIMGVSAEGWRFEQWGGDVLDGSASDNPLTVTMDDDKTITAVFERVDFELEVLVEGNGTVTETVVSQPSGDYPYETVVELLAAPSTGWLFVEWTGDVPDGSATDNQLTVTMDDDKTITAVFEFFGRDTETQVVNVTNPATGATWMDRNLGASRAATAFNDSESYGDLYQWGRSADGHEKRNSPTRSTRSSSDQPGHGDFIIGSDWRSPQNDNLWQGVDGVNNPCPVGYRLPTEAEWQSERQSWSSNNRDGAYGSPLKLPSAGYRSIGDGSVDFAGSNGFYWSSTVDGSVARFLYFNSSDANVVSYTRANGYSVRCRKDEPL